MVTDFSLTRTAPSVCSWRTGRTRKMPQTYVESIGANCLSSHFNAIGPYALEHTVAPTTVRPGLSSDDLEKVRIGPHGTASISDAWGERIKAAPVVRDAMTRNVPPHTPQCSMSMWKSRFRYSIDLGLPPAGASGPRACAPTPSDVTVLESGMCCHLHSGMGLDDYKGRPSSVLIYISAQLFSRLRPPPCGVHRTYVNKSINR